MDDAHPATVADGLDRRLDPRVVALERLTGWIATAVMAGGSLFAIPVVWIANELSTPGLAVLAALWLIVYGTMSWHAHHWPSVAYRYASYRVDRDGIEIRRGVFWRVVVNVPRSRVQHTDVSQGPLERRFGLGTLVIYTAGTDHAKVQLAGLDHALALRIREHLLPTEGADAV